MKAMRKDKKVRTGTLRFILPVNMGEVVQRTDITDDQVRAALEAVR
jgi:3-dehydroquinate synthetase